MDENNVVKILKNDLQFSDLSIKKLQIFHDYLLEYNKKYNLISKSTENSIWYRHILDSAQIMKFLDSKIAINIADLGSGAGFPGLVLALQSESNRFHVKLYEKSAVKRDFLNNIKEKLKLENVEVKGDIYENNISSSIIICRAFKKLKEIIKISREIIKKPHKIIILKGKNAQTEINNVSLGPKYSYKLESSITDHDSKIILVEAN